MTSIGGYGGEHAEQPRYCSPKIPMHKPLHIHKCATCDYEWQHGKSGAHDCSTRLLHKVKELQVENQTLIQLLHELKAKLEQSQQREYRDPRHEMGQ